MNPGHVRDGEESCFKRHKRWSDEWLAGKVRWMVASMLLTNLAAALGVFFFISQAQVEKDNQRDDDRYVHVKIYERDVERMERNIQQLRLEVSTGLEKIADRLQAHDESRRAR